MRPYLLLLLVVSFFVSSSLSVNAQSINTRGVSNEQLKELKKTHYENVVRSWSDFTKRHVKEGKGVPSPTLGVRSLADQALMAGMAVKYHQEENLPLPQSLAETLNQMAPLLELAEQMQDTNSDSRTYGNFRWYWRTTEVTDQNAVEFFVSHAFPLWAEARDVIPADAAIVLERLLQRTVDGCLRHKVRSDYTNIALFNIVHTIVLGETFERDDAVAEGKRRLSSFLNVLYDHGAFEYVSPTYYAVDLDALQFGFRYIKDEELRRSIKVLLDYFWADMALNWYLPGQRLCGAQSRTYDYLLGLGGVDVACGLAGLAPAPIGREGVRLQDALLGTYEPSKEILALSAIFPRQIEQRWGGEKGQWRTSYITKELALGTAGASYGSKQDATLTVDLADFASIPEKKPDAFLPRNYFIPDGREDPYGIKRYPTSTAGHMKPLHLNPYWVASQRQGDALGIAFYPPRCIETNVHTNIQSHFVFRIPDAIYVDGQPVSLIGDSKNPVSVEIGNKTVLIQYGTRVIGIRVLWGAKQDGSPSEVFLVNDHNTRGVWRLTIEQWDREAAVVEKPIDPTNQPRASVTSSEGLDPYIPNEPTLNPGTMSHLPGTALWVRVGEKITDKTSLQKWGDDFAQAKVLACQVDTAGFHVAVTGKEGLLELKGNSPLEPKRSVSYTPSPSAGLLQCNGKEYGKNLLATIPHLANIQIRLDAMVPILLDKTPLQWEAEQQGYFLPECIETVEGASDGKAIRVNDECWWSFEVKKPGTYYLWGRVFALDPEHDSVMAEWYQHDAINTRTLVQSSSWHLGQGRNSKPTWHWVRLANDDKREDVSIELTPGKYSLLLKPREFDVLFDQLYLTTDPQKKSPFDN